MIPAHQRANHERTDDKLYFVRGLFYALTVLHEENECPPPASNAANSKFVLIRLIDEMLEDVKRVRAMEWAGLGGNSTLLTEADRAEALEGTEC